MSDYEVREAGPADRDTIRAIEEAAFGGMGEATLVDALVAARAVVLELVAEADGAIVGHVMFSRLFVDVDGDRHPAVALAPAAVLPAFQGKGAGRAMIAEAHRRLAAAGETLSVVLGDPSYYGQFGYTHDRAAGFASPYQCEALQALAWGEAPREGRLFYATPFDAL